MAAIEAAIGGWNSQSCAAVATGASTSGTVLILRPRLRPQPSAIGPAVASAAEVTALTTAAGTIAYKAAELKKEEKRGSTGRSSLSTCELANVGTDGRYPRGIQPLSHLSHIHSSASRIRPPPRARAMFASRFYYNGATISGLISRDTLS